MHHHSAGRLAAESPAPLPAPPKEVPGMTASVVRNRTPAAWREQPPFSDALGTRGSFRRAHELRLDRRSDHCRNRRIAFRDGRYLHRRGAGRRARGRHSSSSLYDGGLRPRSASRTTSGVWTPNCPQPSGLSSKRRRWQTPKAFRHRLKSSRAHQPSAWRARPSPRSAPDRPRTSAQASGGEASRGASSVHQRPARRSGRGRALPSPRWMSRLSATACGRPELINTTSAPRPGSLRAGVS